MSAHLRELKDKAMQLFAKGRFAKAAEAYAAFCKADPQDVQARLRMGDAWAKAGEKDRAVSAYQWAAEGFAKNGFLPRAIAASKLVLELEPGHNGVQAMLADLYARKAGTGRAAGALRTLATQAPASMSPQLEVAIEVLPQVAETPAAVEVEIEVELSSPDAPGSAVAPAPVAVNAGEHGQSSASDVSVVSSGSTEVFRVEQHTTSTAPNLHAGAPATDAPVPVALAVPSTEVFGAQQPSTSTEAALNAPAPVEAWARGRPGAIELGETDLERQLRELAAADTPAAPAKAKNTSSFTELELEPESLLQAIEAVAAPLSSPSGIAMLEERPASVDSHALPQIPLFSDLPEAAFIALFEECPLRRLAAGEIVFEEGSRGESFFVVCAGSARVVRREAGIEQVLATLDEGAFFGELALLSNAPRTATVIAADEETQLLEIHGEVLKRLSARHPHVSLALKKFSRQRLLANLINSAPLFRPFSPTDRRQLVERFKAREVSVGDVLLTEGQPSDGLYVVLVGEVAVRRGATQLATLREGEVFGEMSLLTRSAAAASVVATRRSSVLRLPRQDFEHLMMSHPQILELVAELTDARG